jgi:hypothetical protein
MGHAQSRGVSKLLLEASWMPQRVLSKWVVFSTFAKVTQILNSNHV